MSLKKNVYECGTHMSCSTHTFYIIRKPISYSKHVSYDISSVTSLFYIFRTTKVNKSRFLHISKNHKKRKDDQKKIL